MFELVADLIASRNIKVLDGYEKIRLLPIYKSLMLNESQILGKVKDQQKAPKL